MKYLDEYVIGTKERFGSYRVTREEVIEFASRFDPQPFHLDDFAAAANPIFGRLAASGWHTAAMTMRMLVDHRKATESERLGSPGLEQVQWKTPVYPGDTLRVETELLEGRRSQSRPRIGLQKTKVVVCNQHDEVVMSFIATEVVPTRN